MNQGFEVVGAPVVRRLEAAPQPGENGRLVEDGAAQEARLGGEDGGILVLIACVGGQFIGAEHDANGREGTLRSEQVVDEGVDGDGIGEGG